MDVLVSLPEPNQFNGDTTLTWTGQLTAQQRQVSHDLLATLAQKREHLVWAVTGAGKTEMLFPVIHRALQAKQRVGIVSPRIDVILELAPRLQAAFQQTPLVVLYGEQPQPYTYTQLVLATTHQMLRFLAAFDLLIIDEVDSFPFAGDAMLNFAVNKAKKTQSTVIYLTATPTKQLRQQLAVSYLPLRFHQHLLPDIRLRLVNNWRHKLPMHFCQQVKQCLLAKRRLLIFVPHIADLKPIYAALSQRFPEQLGDYVSADDARRQAKVQRMRDGIVQFLVTTTILERGVTFPALDVLILGAEESVFSEPALVQMAVRVGRHPDYPSGLVIAYVTHVNYRVLAARHQIR
nr:DEAD/DEAH box helicase family protein [Leuconostoc lactis]